MKNSFCLILFFFFSLSVFAQWQNIAGQARDVGVGANGTAWVIGWVSNGGGNYPIAKWTGSFWQEVPGGAVRIAVAPNGNPWVVNAAGLIYRYNGSAWEQIGGQARDIGIGADGTVWVIGWTSVAGGYNIARWTGSYWQDIPGGAVRIAVDGTGQAWIVNSNGTIFRRQNNTWITLPGAGKDIGVGPDGTAWVIGTKASGSDYAIYKWTANTWQEVDGGATNISVGPGGLPWVVNSNGSIFKRQATSNSTPRDFMLQKATTNFFLPPKKPGSGGDNDFFGHGPKVDINVSISLRSGREIWARITMKAEEQGGSWPNNPDGTCAEGAKEELIYRAPVGVTIEAIMSPISSLLSYFDSDHEEDYVLPGLGERRPEKWRFPQANPNGLVFFARVVGDQNGQDIGVHTGTQVFFNPIKLRVRGQATSPSEVVLRDYFDVKETCGSNSCASSAGSTMMSFYNRNVTCEEFKQKLNNRGNLVTQFELGTPPGTLRDQLRDYGLNVQEYNLGNNLIPTLESTIRSGKPVIILTGWGSKSVRGYYAPGYDTNSWNDNSAVHYVVVYGFDPVRKTFCISDNGYRDIWTYQYLQEMVWFHPELQLEILLKSMNVWPPGKAIY